MTDNQSILDSIKKLLGMEADYTAFDTDIIIHINTAFSTLQQLGVGPTNAFFIADNKAKWDEFIDDAKLNAVKSYIYIRVRLLFDPPETSHAREAFSKQAQEMEWRLNVQAEGTV